MLSDKRVHKLLQSISHDLINNLADEVKETNRTKLGYLFLMLNFRNIDKIEVI